MNDVKLNGPKTLVLKPEHLAYILDTLAVKPFNEVNGIINDILRQLMEGENSGKD